MRSPCLSPRLALVRSLVCGTMPAFPLYSWTMTSRDHGCMGEPTHAERGTSPSRQRRGPFERRATPPARGCRPPRPDHHQRPPQTAEHTSHGPATPTAAAGTPPPPRTTAGELIGGVVAQEVRAGPALSWMQSDRETRRSHCATTRWPLHVLRTRRESLLPMRREEATARRRMHPEYPGGVGLGLPPRVDHVDDRGLLLRSELGSAPPDPPACPGRRQARLRALADHGPLELGKAAHHLV